MRKSRLLAFALSGLCALTAQAQHTVTIKGNVKFTDPGFKVSVYRHAGTDKQVLAEAPVADDHTYTVSVPFEKAGEAVVDCGRWQSVNVWLEDEDLNIDFRGKDTAKVIIKNPPYVYIYGGKKNEVMNLVNFVGYRGYQTMIAISKSVWNAKIEDKKKASELSSSLYDFDGDNRRAWFKYIVEHYADQTSILAPIRRLNAETNADIIEPALARLEATSAEAKEMVADYRKSTAEAKEKRERMKEGNPAPDFTFLNVKGKKVSLNKYKGKVLLLDFWASWCGPCRAEIPNMKKYYAAYKDKGVEFLSVSIDAKKEAWTKAMKEEGMAWQQGWTTDAGKEVMNTYQFGGIPYIILIDKQGNIYKKNLRGEEIKAAIDDCLAGKPAKAPKAIGAMGMM